jgi:hypothetical protein
MEVCNLKNAIMYTNTIILKRSGLHFLPKISLMLQHWSVYTNISRHITYVTVAPSCTVIPRHLRNSMFQQ